MTTTRFRLRRPRWRALARRQWRWAAVGGFALLVAGAGALTSESGTGACNIKGNIASDGEHIYHVPGQTYYGATRIDFANGERMFCSETDAREAGWRKARL